MFLSVYFPNNTPAYHICPQASHPLSLSLSLKALPLLTHTIHCSYTQTETYTRSHSPRVTESPASVNASLESIQHPNRCLLSWIFFNERILHIVTVTYTDFFT